MNDGFFAPHHPSSSVGRECSAGVARVEAAAAVAVEEEGGTSGWGDGEEGEGEGVTRSGLV